MTFHRLTIAAAALLFAVLLKLLFPVFGTELVPALKTVLSVEQIRIVLPAGGDELPAP